MDDRHPLRYRDETDRAYGIAGMAISLVLWDGEPYLASLSLDNPVGSSIEFTPIFGFNGNPRLTASLAWRELLKQFELSVAMIMGNVICRSYLGSSTSLSADKTSALRDVVRSEGKEFCSLDDDESDIVYNKTYRYLDRVFSHSGVSGLVEELAGSLKLRRRLSASEVFEILSALNRM